MFTGVAKKCFLVHDKSIIWLSWSYPDCYPITKRKVPNQMDKGLFEFYFMQISVSPFMHDFYFFSFFSFFFLPDFILVNCQRVAFFLLPVTSWQWSTRFASWLWVAFGHSPINCEKKEEFFLMSSLIWLHIYAEATRYSVFAFEILLKIIMHWKLKTIKLFSIVVWILLCINYSLKMWKFFSITF